jgi:positive regulator of sigma E activity
MIGWQVDAAGKTQDISAAKQQSSPVWMIVGIAAGSMVAFVVMFVIARRTRQITQQQDLFVELSTEI